MKSNWTIDKNSTGVLSVTVDAEEWQKAQKKAFNKLKSGLTLKGFRKGQIPDAVAKKTIVLSISKKQLSMRSQTMPCRQESKSLTWI